MLNSFYDKFIFTNGIQYTHSNFYLVNMPFVMLPADLLAGIAAAEDGAANRHMYKAIKEAVRQNVRKDFQIDFGVEGEKGLEFMQAYFIASGWGQMEFNDINSEKGHALISVANSPVAANCKNAKAPVDTVLRGILAGIFSTHFRKDVECVEVKCAALNAQQCDFIVKPLAEFDFGNPNTRAQLEV
ncbi:MAG: hypothetical protein HY544_02705 [Candidatus Diapherotrites archaeon]|uniref:4-vinyl reductase 4VR domain-containing protein n=1 Tax=Candidatus Iainarchaeum sp. TaxID=3101447 RepID=A0A8T3YKQ7_9ARCH|nr:hypothetical protein [Candidatus Diapherotrites archaeon]